MFENIGGKIKVLAVVSTILGCIACIVLGIIELASNAILAGLFTIFLGCILSWLGSFLLYGLGELIETNQKIATMSENAYNCMEKISDQLRRVGTENKRKESKEEIVPKTKSENVVQESITDVAMRNFKEGKYIFALKLFNQENYNDAYNEFLKIEDYKDAKDYIKRIEQLLK